MVSLSDFGTTGNDITKVNVEGINERALSGIRNAILATKNSIDRQSTQLRDQHDDDETNRRSDQIASLAKQRQDRASQAALYGKIDKGLTGIETLHKSLKNAFDKLIDIVGSMAANALKSYDQTARGLREIFMSTADMKTEMIKADRASQKLRAEGITVTSQQTKQTIEQLNKNGFDSRKFSEEQIAAISVGLKSGLSLQAAVAQSQRAKNQIALAKTFATASQQTGRETFKAISEALEKDQTATAVYMKRTGKAQETATADILTYAQQLDSVLGGYLSNDEQAKILQQMMLLNSKQLDKLNQPFAALLGISPDAFKNAPNREELMTQGIYKMIQSGNVEYLNVLKNAVGQDSPLIDAVSQAQAAYKAGNYKLGMIYEDETQAIDAFNKNNPGGEIGALIDGLMTDINTFTDSIGIKGGIFGGLAAEVNELFGDSVGMEDIVTTGFKETLKILKNAASNGWGGTSALLSGIFEGGVSAFGTSLLTGAKGTLANTILQGLTNTFKAGGLKGLLLNGLRTAIAPLLGIITPILPWVAGIVAVVGIGTAFAKWINRREQEDKGAEDQNKKVANLEKQLVLAQEQAVTYEQHYKDTGDKTYLNKAAAAKKEIEQLTKTLEVERKIANKLNFTANLNDDQANEYTNKLYSVKTDLESSLKQRSDILNNIEKLKSEGFTEDSETMKIEHSKLDANRKQVSDLIEALNRLSLDAHTTGTSNIIADNTELSKNVFEDLQKSGALAADAFTEFKTLAETANSFIKESKDLEDRIYKKAESQTFRGPKYASGGIFQTATNAIIGEAGKEILLPLTRPDRLRELLGSLSRSEKASIINALNESNNKNTTTVSNSTTNSQNIQSNSSVPGNDPASIKKILSYASNQAYVYDSLRYGRNKDGSLKSKDPEYGNKKREAWYKESLQNAQNREGYDLIKGTWAERALAWGASQIGLPYLLRSIGKLGYVCNELTNAALLGSGYDLKDFRIHGVKTTFANISAGKMVSGKDRKGRMREYPSFRLRPDITPETAIPGILFFQDSSKNKDGQFAPGHVGLVYYGHQRLHSAGGSGSYDGPAAFLDKYQTPCRGVTVNEFDPNARYMFGELPGLFEQASGDWEPPKNSPVEFGPTDVDTTGNNILKEQSDLSKSAIGSVIDKVSKYYNADMQRYAKQTAAVASAGNAKEIISFMEIMVKYLRDIATSPANKKPAISPSRPIPNKY